jgi:hypothetical protein
MEPLLLIFLEPIGISFKLLRMDFVKKPLVATMSEVPLHLAPPVQ